MSISNDLNTEDLRIYAILNLREPPRLLINKSGSKQFHCYFGLPLPPQIVVFRLGKCTSTGYSSRISIDVCLDSEIPSFRIGYLEKNIHSACHQPKWSNVFLTRSHILHEKDRMAKLLLTIVDGDKNGLIREDLSNITPEKFQQIEKRQLIVKLSNEIIPPFPINVCSSSPEQPTKKMKKHDSKETRPKRKKESFPVDWNNNHLVQTTLMSSFSKISQNCITELTPAPSPSHTNELPPKPPPAKSSPKPDKDLYVKEHNIWPSGRWGHSACTTSDNKVIIIGGQGDNYQMVKDSLYVLDCGSSTWKAEKVPQCDGADRRMGHTSTFDPVKNVIYVYGGCKYKRWFKDVNILDMDTLKWTNVKAVGIAPKRAYHTSVLFQGELLVFGGVYPKPDPQPDGCSNNLYIFNPETSSWYQPIVTGEEPAPCSGHSLELYKEDKAIIFGGWDAPQCYNDVFFLDLGLMEYNKPDVIGTKPTPRSWHASALVGGNNLLIHGGFDGENNLVLGDSFIFDIEKISWLKVSTSLKMQPCVGHVMFCCHQTSVDKEQIMVFGGGDNRGNFFSDLLSVEPLTDQKL